MKDIALVVFCLLVCLFLLARNVYMLVRSVRFRREVKGIPEKKLKKTEAVVKYCRKSLKRSSLPGDTAAVVFYPRDGKDIEARMICASEGSVLPAQKVSVLTDSTGRLFAYDVQQIKNAVLTYSVFSVLSAAAVVGLCMVLYFLCLDNVK